MIKQLLYKWFGLDPIVPCTTCEVLHLQLAESNRERKELLHKLLDKDKPEPLITEQEEMKPIQPQFTPWRVRQQMLEAEDRRTAQILKERLKEMEASKIDVLEQELGIGAK